MDRVQRCGEHLTVLVAGVFEAVDQMHDAGLNGGPRTGRADCDRADEIGRYRGAVALSQNGLSLAHAHAAGVHRDDAFVDADEVALMLGNRDRFEAAVAIAGGLRPEPDQDR